MFQIKTFFKLMGLISVTILMLQCIEVRCTNPTILYNTGKFTGISADLSMYRKKVMCQNLCERYFVSS